jgi:acetyl-CoA C-acetyltransferase
MTMLDAVANDGLTDSADGTPMGSLTETGNTGRGISRAEQDEIAASPHQRASQAVTDGLFAQEIAPIEVPQHKGKPVVLSVDEGIRPDSTPQTLAELRPAFDPQGTITAGNSLPLSDGAAAVVLARRGWAEARGLPWLAVAGQSGQVAGPDTSLHSQPARAVQQALPALGMVPAAGVSVSARRQQRQEPGSRRISHESGRNRALMCSGA